LRGRLATRSVVVEADFTGADLKGAIATALNRGQYVWWDANGEPTRINAGVTLIAIEKKAEDENGGTDAVALGEELIIDTSQAMSLKGGKGATRARRIVSGQQCAVTEPMIAFLGLTPEQMTLSYEGKAIGDDERLFALGCRTDDAVELEFESPAQPDILKLLRGPEPEKPAKGGGKKKK
jgi:hypothetical protein